MLSRIGNSLFWMGRYIERTEHIARYTKVQYVSSVDVPLGQNRDLVLESILDMAGSRRQYTQTQQQLVEDEVISYITISDTNPYSLIGYIGMIRENARGARDRLSIELWEAINSFYHKTSHYTPEVLQREGVENFSRKIEEQSYVIKGYIDNTLLRNEEWRLISLGIYLERAIQVCLILQTKIKDIQKIDSDKFKGALENHYWTTLLESTESFDMYMRCQKTPPNRHNVLHFLLFDMDFPKSVAFSLANVKNCIQGISFQEESKKNSLEFIAGKLSCGFSYTTIEEVENAAAGFLESTLTSIYNLSHLLDTKYLKYK